MTPKINAKEAIERVEALLKEEKAISPALKAAIEVILLLVTVFFKRLGLNSRNSSKPPSYDPNRDKKSKKNSESRKPGGQNGHVGTQLEKFENPDEIIESKLDRSILPPGNYCDVGFESRQVVELIISRHVIEYRAEILENESGQRFVASFPEAAKTGVQYGQSVKSHSVYLSLFQLLPYNRIHDYFCQELKLPISMGSAFNFNLEASEILIALNFDEIVRQNLIASIVVHADETGININGKRHWLHTVCNNLWTYFFPHVKRGCEAMDAMEILSNFTNVLCHDHWKPYYTYNCLHSLCNAHHLRELECAFEQDNQAWAKEMQVLLTEMKQATQDAGGFVSEEVSIKYHEQYREILSKADIECPPANSTGRKEKRKVKQTKSRNLLMRLRNFENDVLRFLDSPEVPFTNNQGENDLRMTKVQQKISGCFRSMEGAEIFCRVRSYITTCRKQGMTASDALKMLFQKKLPDFICFPKDIILKVSDSS